MVKKSISRDSWEVYYLGDGQKVAEGEFTRGELKLMEEIEDLWFSMQLILSQAHRDYQSLSETAKKEVEE